MANERAYLDFEIHLQNLDRDKNLFQVLVPRIEGVGETTQPLHVPFLDEDGDLEYALSSLERRRGDMETMIDLGILLAERLFPEGEVRDLFQDARNRAGLDGGVRLRLIVSTAKIDRELARIPWEFVHDPVRLGEKGGHFLALDPRISIVRHIPQPSPQESIEPRTSERLALSALLANATIPGQKPLDLDVEKTVLVETFKEFDADGVRLDWQPIVENATKSDLEKAVLSKPDILHFSGHGIFDTGKVDPETGRLTYEGKLAFQSSKDDPTPALVDAETLGDEMRAAGVRITVLGACNSGRQDGLSLWTGVAPSIVQGGIPAVVGMQYEVVDSSAILFHRAFYTALGAGLSVDEAVSHGRRKMLDDNQIQVEKNVQWGIPVLYMRAGSGQLFPRLEKLETQHAREIRLINKQTIEKINAGASVTGIKLVISTGSKDDITARSEQNVDEVDGDLTGLDVKFN